MYTPPQEQEQNKNNLSRNCTEKCAHNMTHSLDCERYESMMLIFTPTRNTPTLLTKSKTFVCHAYPSPSNSNLSPLTSHLPPLTSAPPPSPLASHLSPPTRQLSPLTVHLSPSDNSPSPLQRSLTAYPKTMKDLIGQHARQSRQSPHSPDLRSHQAQHNKSARPR